MLKKIDLGQEFLMANAELFQCPICQSAVFVSDHTLVCKQNHRFDLSKKGTLYFLNHTMQSHYSKKLFLARRQMILGGMYDPLISVINQALVGEALLDVGSGEGSFLKRLVFQGAKIGFDIAKDGVALSSDYNDSQTFFCAADLTNLPFKNASISTILNILTPSHYQEFHRVLSNGGKLIKVVPEQDYLRELRVAYQQPTEYSNQLVLEKFKQNFKLVTSERLTYQFELPEVLRPQLLEMSPLEWQVPPRLKEKIKNNPLKQITIDIRILVGE
ncbi:MULTISPECIES: putative RNA methyltransferase [unclassified Enterococcus]|uniref:putative RNA methyltransferase n=1 Tax=unclassified Enterococcus TaxID=2608891 RepID=UPI001553FDCC|nr:MULTISPECIES: methyltransferase domain-containing protein [unclassified Enterococcus]MBS7578055.1 methyltransferase domain-containing protein [Enterococcus sp. MMGLQ5-2]MBS7585255.1 methyltransferase domain-containing protein [Enterococcus sp. MMGLQ5-1]NPD13112.1 methyltransferase domain-containing protein [Enterococcus sp. MMGLQ5-1]NPD37886.1 methyltransferase domain-containing protein [Enterococcus sp. MMGLQ5-2]